MQQKRAMQDLTALQERTHNDNVRLGCITRKADIVNHMIEKLQVLGIIETSPEKLDIRLEDLRLQDVARMFKKYEKKGA